MLQILIIFTNTPLYNRILTDDTLDSVYKQHTTSDEGNRESATAVHVRACV